MKQGAARKASTVANRPSPRLRTIGAWWTGKAEGYLSELVELGVPMIAQLPRFLTFLPTGFAG